MPDTAADLGKLRYLLSLEDGDFKNKLKENDASIKKFSESANKLGKELTTKLTLPIAAVGIAAVKMAADFEISSRKFAKAFVGAEKQASAAIENLNKSYGLSVSQSTQLLANTGDLYKGFGASSDAALTMSLSVQQLAASLSAYNGVPVAEASAAITKATLGETEGLKQLGVVIKQTDIDQQILKKGQQDLEGQALLLARAQATLELSYQQSGDAVASFASNQNTLAFQTNQLIGDAKDLAVELGTILIPVVKDLVSGIRDGVSWFKNLSTEQKQTIITIAAIAASIGPLISVIGAVTGAVTGLQVALAFLAANPIVLVIAGLAAATGAIVAWSVAAEDARVKELTAEFGDLADATKMTKKEIKEFVQAADAVDDSLQMTAGQSFEDLQFQVKELANNLDLTDQQVIEIGLHNKDNTEETKRQLTVLLDQIKKENEIVIVKAAQGIKLDGLLEREKYIQAAKNSQLVTDQKITEEKQKQADLEAYIAGKYSAAANDYLNIINSDKTEIELLKEKIALYETLIGSDKAYEKQRLEALEILRKQLKEAEEQEIKDKEEQAQKEIDIEKKKQEEIDKAKEEADKKRQEQDQARLQADLEIVQNYASALATIFDGIFQIQLNNIDTETQAKIESLDRQRLGEEEYQKQVEKINKEAALKKYAIEKKQFYVKQAASAVAVVIDTAQAIMKAFAELGPIGGAISTAVLAGISAVQLGLIASQPPPARPQLAAGGIASATPGGIPVTIAEGGSDEAVIPLNDAFFNRLASAAQGLTEGTTVDSGANNNIVNKIYLDGRVIAESTANYAKNRQIVIDARSVV